MRFSVKVNMVSVEVMTFFSKGKYGFSRSDYVFSKGKYGFSRSGYVFILLIIKKTSTLTNQVS